MPIQGPVQGILAALHSPPLEWGRWQAELPVTLDPTTPLASAMEFSIVPLIDLPKMKCAASTSLTLGPVAHDCRNLPRISDLASHFLSDKKT